MKRSLISSDRSAFQQAVRKHTMPALVISAIAALTMRALRFRSEQRESDYGEHS
jgi:hypothetical protein